MKYAQVLVNINKIGARTFSYLIPEEFASIIKIGQPVLVPFGTQGVINAFVVGFSDYLPPEIKAKKIYEILDIEPVFDLEYLHFLNWVSEYYACELPVVMSSAIPMKFFAQSKRIIRLIDNEQNNNQKLTADDNKIITFLKEKKDISVTTLQKKLKIPYSRFYNLIRKLREKNLVEIVNIIEETTQKTQFLKYVTFLNDNTENKRYKAILTLLKSNSEKILLNDFIKMAHTTMNTIKKLEELNYLKIEEEEVYRNPLGVFSDVKKDKFPELSMEQQQAWNILEEALDNGVSTPILLYGVTGSGKTEVYFKAMQRVLQEGKNVLFLAPEIAIASMLTERIVRRFSAENVAIWHSSISDGERFDVWEKIKRNQINILVGARSAIFAPLKDIGLIIVDEEHDSSYKQTTPAPRYNAKHLAIERARRIGATVVFGSATPDIVTYYQAKNSNSLISLKERYGKSILPSVHIIDMRQEMQNKNFSIFSRTLKNAIKSNLEKKKQTILLINRRGFSTILHCPACGHIEECEKCSIPLIMHKTTNTLRCHYCNFEKEIPSNCPKCGFEGVVKSGMGTQKVEEETIKHFPEARVARLDSDILQRKNQHIEILKKFNQGEIDILVGTQMIAKGLDNPNVTLVGVLSADNSFSLPDYRASERGFQLLAQVAGRAGRGDFLGEVFFQTYSPDFYAMQSAKYQDFEGFYEKEIEEREDFSYPPFSQIIRLVLSAKNEFRAEKLSLEIVMRLKNIIEKQGQQELLEVLGPASCVISKIKDEYRYQIMIKNRLGERGHFFIASFIKKIIMPDDIKLSVDINPTDML